MSPPLYESIPERYARCRNCDGAGELRCRECAGSGSVVGTDRYLIGGRIGRRFGLKVCAACGGRGSRRCSICVGGSVERT